MADSEPPDLTLRSDGKLTEEAVVAAFDENGRSTISKLVKIFKAQLKDPVHKKANRKLFQIIIDKVAQVQDVGPHIRTRARAHAHS